MEFNNTCSDEETSVVAFSAFLEALAFPAGTGETWDLLAALFEQSE